MTDRNAVSLLGASVLSAAGSLPLHLMPLIVVSLVADGRAQVAAAGWVASAVLLGQLVASLVLPSCEVGDVRRGPVIGVALMLLAGLLSTVSSGFAVLLVGWFIVGCCCGVLLYLGTITAASHRRPSFAFSIRLGVVLTLAGTVVGILQWTVGLVSYPTMLVVLSVVFGLILAAGIVLFQPTRTERATMAAEERAHVAREENRRWPKLAALAMVYVLFVGQTGFFAYVLQGATERGMVLAQVSWAFAFMKALAGVFLLALARMSLRERHNPRFVELGALLAASNLVVASTKDPAIFLLGLFGVEIGLNFLSARVQAKVVEFHPHFGGRWLVATILLGAASGPPLHGAAISVGGGVVFIAFAMLSALVPAAMAMTREKRYINA